MILPYDGKRPEIGRDAFIAPGAAVIGDVTIGAGASVWFSAVVRGDMNRIAIGERTNVQDGAVIHVDAGSPTAIGRDVTIGHGAIVHGATVGDGCLIGMGATVLDGAVIGERTLVGAGALVTPNTVVPPESLVVGAPARVKRPLTPEELAKMAANARGYVETARRYLAEAAR